MKSAEERFLSERNDTIDNAVFAAICSLVHEGSEIEWDMNMIGEIEDAIESLLIERGVNICHPWHDENENICYRVDKCSCCNRE